MTAQAFERSHLVERLLAVMPEESTILEPYAGDSSRRRHVPLEKHAGFIADTILEARTRHEGIDVELLAQVLTRAAAGGQMPLGEVG